MHAIFLFSWFVWDRTIFVKHGGVHTKSKIVSVSRKWVPAKRSEEGSFIRIIDCYYLCILMFSVCWLLWFMYVETASNRFNLKLVRHAWCVPLRCHIICICCCLIRKLRLIEVNLMLQARILRCYSFFFVCSMLVEYITIPMAIDLFLCYKNHIILVTNIVNSILCPVEIQK